MSVIPYIPEKMLCKSSKYILAYNKGFLIIRSANGEKIIQRLRIHSFIKSFALLERLLRYEPKAAYALKDEIFIYSDHGAIYQYNVDSNTKKKIHSFKRGMNNPLSFCGRKNESGELIELVYGEYIWNLDKGPVSIYKYDLNSWKEAYRFPENTVLHIHNIVLDEKKKRYLILTGDSNDESAIWCADYDFVSVKKIIGGEQKYRSCVAYPTETGIYYATDTPLESNYVYFLSNDGFLKRIHIIPGPCIYGRIYNDCLYMATSVEGDPTQGRWKYRFSNKLGVGVMDRRVHIIKCDQHGNVTEVGDLKKDIFPMWLFQFGNAQFPITETGLYITAQSTIEKGTYYLFEDEIDGCFSDNNYANI